MLRGRLVAVMLAVVARASCFSSACPSLFRPRPAGFCRCRLVCRPGGVPADAVEALDVHEQGPIVGRAGGLQDADDREGPVLVLLPAGHVVRGAERVADLQAGLPRHRGADDRLEVVVRLEVAAALGELVRPGRPGTAASSNMSGMVPTTR